MPGKIVPIPARCAAVLFLVALVSGCSAVDSGVTAAARLFGNECGLSRDACLYEGSYEPGERAYAENEARRLNQASLERLRRNAGG